MDTLPIELVTIIATSDFELFITLLRVNTIGQRLCDWYPQMYAREKFIKTIVDKTYGDVRTYLNDRLHSFNDLPAVHYNDDKYNAWYKYGLLHRDNDLPAVISHNVREWRVNGKLHRDNNRPAFKDIGGTKCWYLHGRYQRATIL